MVEPTKGLRLAFSYGILGLHFVVDGSNGRYPETNGPTDMAYINELIKKDEERRAALGETDE